MAAAADTVRISVVIPALNEATGIVAILQPLQALRARGQEVIVVDGGSSDHTVRVAAPLADRVLQGTAGRAVQMNAGARVARGAVLWFLHADTRAPADADLRILDALADGDRYWGYFDVRLEGPRLLRAVAWMMNRRARLSAIATGDQGIFVTRSAFTRAGGYPPVPLMEDIALCRSLRRGGRPAVLQPPLFTSNRRWRKHGVMTTILLMWLLRFAYFIGISPARLATFYPGHDA